MAKNAAEYYKEPNCRTILHVFICQFFFWNIFNRFTNRQFFTDIQIFKTFHFERFIIERCIKSIMTLIKFNCESFRFNLSSWKLNHSRNKYLIKFIFFMDGIYSMGGNEKIDVIRLFSENGKFRINLDPKMHPISFKIFSVWYPKI